MRLWEIFGQLTHCAYKKADAQKPFLVLCLALSTTFLRMLGFPFQSSIRTKIILYILRGKIIPWRLKCSSFAIFLLLNRLFMSSLVTNRSHFLASCSTAPSSSFSNPSPWSPIAKETSPKNLPSRHGCPLPSKRSFQRENWKRHLWSKSTLRPKTDFRLLPQCVAVMYLHLWMSVAICSRRELVPQGGVGLWEICGAFIQAKAEFVQHLGRKDFRQKLAVNDALHLCVDNFSAFLQKSESKGNVTFVTFLRKSSWRSSEASSGDDGLILVMRSKCSEKRWACIEFMT